MSKTLQTTSKTNLKHLKLKHLKPITGSQAARGAGRGGGPARGLPPEPRPQDARPPRRPAEQERPGPTASKYDTQKSLKRLKIP